MVHWRILLIPVILVAVMVAAGCITNPPGPATSPPSPVPTATLAAPYSPPEKITTTPELIAFVANAAAFAREHGRETAVLAFNDQNGSFVIGNVQVFALGYDGTLIADSAEPGAVGTNIQNLTDSFGIPLVQNMAETARYGRGYVSYTYPNPAADNTFEPRIAVVENIDGTYYIGAAMFASEGEIYPSTRLNTSTDPLGVEDLVAYVRDAAEYARAHGRENALSAMNDPKGRFVRGELVIMAFDYNGTNLAAPPYSPELASYRINLINYQDPDGVETIRGMRDLARGGGGFLYTVAKINTNGKTIYVPKIDYAEPVDNEWWIFSGIIVPEYTSAGSGNLTGIQLRTLTREHLYLRVNEAVAFAHAHGKEKTLREINDPKGRFVTGDLFVWASSHDGVLLADPFWKSGVGENQWEYRDQYGMKVTQAGIQAMENGTGFSRALFPDTAMNGTENIEKLIYMKAVDDTWWIGSGIYGIRVE